MHSHAASSYIQTPVTNAMSTTSAVTIRTMNATYPGRLIATPNYGAETRRAQATPSWARIQMERRPDGSCTLRSCHGGLLAACRGGTLEWNRPRPDAETTWTEVPHAASGGMQLRGVYGALLRLRGTLDKSADAYGKDTEEGTVLAIDAAVSML